MAVKREKEPITIKKIKKAHAERKDEIRRRLAEFAEIGERGTDLNLWEEMVFCFFTGGCSARMGLNALEAVKPIILTGDQAELAAALSSVHRYPNARSRYIVASRNFLNEHCGLRLRSKLNGFDCALARRDWLVNEEGIKGLGYKEASHYLRNIGFKGYAILDKHVLNCLAELKIIDDPKPPNTRSKYLTIEDKLKKLTSKVGIDFDELDLVLWSIKTGKILK
ncbi:MAG: N-glycosylase/DNA lyase [Chloracidobacterium sp.]|nr:N-glycosylase/DNA lyase [Chloracidobacterium sp.]